MSRKTLLALCTASFCCCALITGDLLAGDSSDEEEGFEVISSTTVGVQAYDVDGDADGAEKYRDGLDDEVVLEEIDVKAKQDDFFFSLKGRDLGQDDQRLVGTVGKYGIFRMEGVYDSAPRNYADGQFLGTLQPGGYWAIPDATQELLQANFTPLNEQPTAAEQQVLLDVLTGANVVTLETLRKTGALKFEFTPFKDYKAFNVRAGISRQTKEGSRALSTGAYNRSSTGATAFGGVGENFRLYGLEFPNLIDFETNTMDLGFDYRKNNWFADFSYRYVDFNNEQDFITWDNPLLLNGVNGKPGGAALNQLDLAPDAQSNTISFTGGVSGLPLNSRIIATLSWDKITQDDNFLPYTVNTAVLDNFDNVAATRPLPVASLNGEVTTTLFNFVWTSSPLPKTSVNLRYNYYDYQNETPVINWDGYVGVGETIWKNEEYTNRVPAYEKSRFGIDGTYRFSPIVKFKAEYYHQEIDRNEYRSASNKEDVFGGTLLISANDWTSLRFRYTYQDRSISGVYTAAIELSRAWQELHMFDMAERKRKSFDAYLGLDPTDRFSLGFSLTYNEDEYGDGLDGLYGLNDAESYIAGFDVNYRISDKTNLAFYVSREDRDTTQLNRSKSDKNGGGSFAVPENDWQTDLGDRTDAFGAVLDANLIPDKLDLTLSFDQSNGKGDFFTANTNFVDGVTISGATAYPWSDLSSDITELKLQLNYRWSKQLVANFRYYYNRFKLSDFAVDSLVPYSAVPSDQQGNVLSHFIFMDANHDDYKAQLIAVSLTYQMR